MNEASNVEALCEKVHELRQRYSNLMEAIFVLNNSTDGTDRVLENISNYEKYQFVKTIQTQGARGSAIRDGVEHARTSIVAVMDSDGQYDPRELPKLVQPITDNEYCMVIGKNHASMSLFRRIMSEAFKKVTRTLLGIGYVQTGFKAGIREVLLETIPRDVPGLDIDVRWMNNIVTKGYGDRLLDDIEVRVYPRLHGRTTFNPIKLALGLLYTTVSLFIQRRTGREPPFSTVLKKLTLYPTRAQ